jgi:hypothetical protein
VNNSVIEYDLPQAATCSLTIISSVGQTMGTLNLGQQAKGKHIISPGQLPMNFSALSNGIYILKMVSSQGTVVTRFLVVH